MAAATFCETGFLRRSYPHDGMLKAQEYHPIPGFPSPNSGLFKTECASDLQSLKRGENELESISETDSSLSLGSSGELSVEEMTDSSAESVMHDGEPRRKVCFCEDVNVREFTQSDPSDTEGCDFVMRLKKGDFSRPVIEAVKLSPEEEAIRSKLVGCIRAEKRVRPDFGKMYGCGKRLRSDDYEDEEDYDSYDDEDEDEDIEKILATKPVRTIQAHAPSACWFTPIF